MKEVSQKSNQKWLPIFLKFIKLLRIDSKEMASSDGRGVKLDLWDSQRIFLEEIAEGLERNVRHFVCLKSRQLGISTVSLALDCFWLCMYPGTIGALVIDSEGSKEVFRATIRRYIESFPEEFFGASFKIVKGGDNRNFMRFSNGSRLDFLVAGTRKKTAWAEGRAYTFCHCSEVSKYGSAEGLSSFMETLAKTNEHRLFIFESTAQGWNHFKDMWDEAKRDSHTKKGIFIGWWSCPTNIIQREDPRFAVYGSNPPTGEERELIDLVKKEYGYEVRPEQLAWYRFIQSDETKSEQVNNQNQPWIASQSFVQAGFSFFPARQLQKDYSRILGDVEGIEPPEFEGFKFTVGENFQTSQMEKIVDQERINEVVLRVWERPVKEAQYVIGCDPAFGRNDWKDRHAISVHRCYADKLVQIAEYADNEVETHVAAWVLAYLAGSYRNSMVNVELTGGAGLAVIREFQNLKERMRSDIYRVSNPDYDWDDFLQNARWYLYHRIDSFGRGGYMKCFESSGKHKFDMMNMLRSSYSSNLLLLKSKPLVEEMFSVVQEGYNIEAPGRSKDDRVFALGLANMTWEEHFRQRLISLGETYEKSVNRENGEDSMGQDMVNNIVTGFLKSQEEMEEMHDERPTWLVERGLA